MKNKIIFLAIPAITLVLGMTACSDDNIFGSVSVTNVSLNKMYTSIVVGGTETLFYKIEPSNATNKDVIWSSDKPDVAWVSAKGEVTGLKTGEARITVTPKNSNKSASCMVAVTNFGVYLNKDKTTLVKGGKESLVATIFPPTATNQKVKWSSDTPYIATVEDGTVTGNIVGTAIITVTTEEGGKTASCEVTVIDFGVSLNKEETSLVVGGKETLFYNIIPDNAANKNVKWSSKDFNTNTNTVAEVTQEGEVTGKRAGIAIITVTTEEGNKTATCKVTVSSTPIPVQSVSLGTSGLEDTPKPLNVYETAQLTPTIVPSNATNQNVKWTSSNANVAVVSSSGTVAGLGVGTVTITVTTEDGNKTAYCKFNVSHTPITDIILNKTKINLLPGTAETLIPYITPASATNKGISWSSWDGDTEEEPENPTHNVVRVDVDGKVNGKQAGTATVTATTVISGKKAICKVIVSDDAISVDSISLDKTSLELFVGQTETLIPTFSPTNATNQNVVWSSTLDYPSYECNAPVTEYGKVTGLKAGTATITVITEDGYKTASCDVIVKYIIVKFENTHETEIKSQDEIIYGGKATRPQTDPTRLAYKFVNWYSDEDLTEVYDFKTSLKDNQKLYAKWKVDMAEIPDGSFTMGSPAGEAPVEITNEVQHPVTLSSGFWMGKYQVTQEQYEEVMKTNPSSFTASVNGESGTPGKLPVERVSWYDAIVFCNKLSMKEGLSPAYSINGETDPDKWGTVPTSSNSVWNAVGIADGSNGYRLPTEAQWEYACRAGTTTAYNTGATADPKTGWYSGIGGIGGNSESKTHQVGLKPVDANGKIGNIWGLYDMHGNVFEWCWDWYTADISSYTNDPVGPPKDATITTRLRRGGCWNQSADNMRSAYRSSHAEPNNKTSQVGFRVVRPADI
jgi:uncharacterized repeat protein (TIGR02543 family)